MPDRTLKLTPPLLCAQPIDSLSCKTVKGGYRQLQIVDLGILRFVVAEPGKRLSEHHNRRNSRTRNLSGIMQRPGRQFVRRSGRLADRFVAKFNQPRIKEDRLDAPDLRPLDRTTLLRGESSAGGPRPRKHR